jgi:hypothetical protein
LAGVARWAWELAASARHHALSFDTGVGRDRADRHVVDPSIAIVIHPVAHLEWLRPDVVDTLDVAIHAFGNTELARTDIPELFKSGRNARLSLIWLAGYSWITGQREARWALVDLRVAIVIHAVADFWISG